MGALPLHRIYLLYIVVLCSSFPAFAQHCYFPNGTDRNLGQAYNYYQPCGSGSSVDQYTMCCATYRQPPDTCLKNGLCQNNLTGPHFTWRESCTDPTWKSPSCIKLCVNGTDQYGSEMSASDEMVTPCPDGSYCCGQNATDCCNDKKGVWIVNGTTTNVNPASATKTSSSSTTQTPTITGEPASPGTTATSSQNDTGAIVGGVVGGLAVLVLAAGAAYYFFRRKSRRQDAVPESTAKYSELAPDANKSPTFVSEVSGAEVIEMDGTNRRTEMDGGRNDGPELQGDAPHHELE